MGFFQADVADEAGDIEAGDGAQLVVDGRRAGAHVGGEGVAVVGIVVEVGVDKPEGAAEELLVGRFRGDDDAAGLVGTLLVVFGLDALAVLDDVVDAQLEVAEAEGLREILVGSEEQRLLLVFVLRLGGEEDDGQMAVVGVVLDCLRELVAVHLGHHHVGDDEVEVFLPDDVEGLATVLGSIDAVGRSQQLLHEHEEFDIVFDDEQAVDVLVGVILRIAVLVVDFELECLDVDDGILGEVEVDGACLVDLIVNEGFLVDRQLDGEGGALAHLALTLDGAVVQEDEVVGEVEPETCADGLVLAVFTVVEPLEEVLHLLRRDAVACVAHLDADVVEGRVRLYLQRHLTVFVGVFGGIGEEVVDDFVEFVGIDPAHHALGVAGDGEMLALAHQEGLDALGCLADVAHDVALCDDQLELACLRLAGLEDLLQQAHHSLDVELHEVVVVSVLGRLVAEFVDGGGDDGEWRQQFVGDVGEDITHLQSTAQAEASQVEVSAYETDDDDDCQNGKN